jgi:antitoxin component YwqK of YwqJK toxin-antitoxin module
MRNIQHHEVKLYQMANYKKIIWFITLFLAYTTLFAQKNPDKKTNEENLALEDDFLKPDSVPSLVFELSKEEISVADQKDNQKKVKKKKKKKKYYFGIQTKQAFIKESKSSGTELEVFRVINVSYLMKNPYQQQIHYYDVKSRKIRTDDYYNLQAKIKKGQSIFLLHGIYKEFKNGQVRTQGYFFKGLKHSKWEVLDGKDILLEKLKYHLGFPITSKITYYDADETKVKEIIPIVHGRKQGKYYLFYENGVIAEEGEYDNDQKVKYWREFYENRARKKDTQYPTQWYEKKDPVKLREWDTTGKLIYDIDRGGKL